MRRISTSTGGRNEVQYISMCERTQVQDRPSRPASRIQSRTELIMGTLPTGSKALESTLVPSLNGYRLKE